MTGDEAERIWSALRKLDERIDALESSAATRDDLARLRDSIDALEAAVMDVLRWERDSVVQPMPAPKFSLAPVAKLRMEAWKWAVLAAVVALASAATWLAQWLVAD